jgi:hypothetical protein
VVPVSIIGTFIFMGMLGFPSTRSRSLAELVASFAKWIKSCNDKGLGADLCFHHRTKPNAE